MLAVISNEPAGASALLKFLSGKTTSDVIVQGFRLLNSKVITDLEKPLFSYVPANGVFYGTLTVEEHLMYQVLLRTNGSIPFRRKKQLVQDIVNELELTSCSNKIIGIPGRLKGINAEERKRLLIASKLLNEARVLLCEDPTFGLDFSMAANIVRILKSLTLSKYVIVCSLEHPSSKVFETFNRVLLLSSGHVLFMGKPDEALEFFNSIGYVCPEHWNPAEFFMDTLSDIGTDEMKDSLVSVISKRYAASSYATKYMPKDCPYDLKSHATEVTSTYTFNFSRYKLSWCAEFWILLRRSYSTMKREPTLTSIQMGQALVMAVFLALMFQGNSGNADRVSDLNSILFIILINVTFMSILPTVTLFQLDLFAFQKEHSMGYCRSSTFLLSRSIIEFQTLVLVPVVFIIIVYWSCGLRYDSIAFLLCLAVSFLVANISYAFGQMIACWCKAVALTLGIVSIVCTLLMFCGGFFIHKFSIPIYLAWIKYVSWFAYGYEILIVNQWLPIESTGSICLKSGRHVIQSLGFQEDAMIFNFAMLGALFLIFRFLSFFFLWIRFKFYERN